MRKVLAVLAAVAVVALLLLRGTCDGAPDEPVAPAPESAAESAPADRPDSGRPTGRARAAAPEPARPAAPETQPGTTPEAATDPAPGERPAEFLVHLRALRVSGAPAVGAVVTLREPVVPEGEDDLRVWPARGDGPRTWTTDDRGCAEVSIDDRGDLSLRVDWERREVGHAWNVTSLGSDVVVKLRPAVVLEGRVEGPDGAPVAGARCTLSWPRPEQGWNEDVERVTTDAGGAFRFLAVPAFEGEDSGWIEVRAAGFVDASEHIPADPALAGPIVIRLARGLTVIGRCLDERGRPVPRVRLRSRGGTARP